MSPWSASPMRSLMNKINKVELKRTDDGYVGAGTHTGQEGIDKRIQKLEIQVNCLRKQVLDLEGKKFHTFDSSEAQRQHVLGDPSLSVSPETYESNASWRSRTTIKEEDDNK